VGHGRKSGGDLKYVICNGDEGDPGAFMDRSVLESDPQRVLEGMSIAAYAVGARKVTSTSAPSIRWPWRGWQTACAMRGGAACLATTLQHAVQFRCRDSVGAGAFVCGEETALIASIEGKRGTPKPRPPYPA